MQKALLANLCNKGNKISFFLPSLHTQFQLQSLNYWTQLLLSKLTQIDAEFLFSRNLKCLNNFGFICYLTGSISVNKQILLKTVKSNFPRQFIKLVAVDSFQFLNIHQKLRKFGSAKFNRIEFLVSIFL